MICFGSHGHCMYTHMYICDQYCQNLELIIYMNTMAKNSFHHQWIAPSVIISTLLPNVDGSAFAEACFWGLSDIHECSGVHWLPQVGFYRQPLCWKLLLWLVDDIGHGFSYILWQFEYNGASLWAISPWKLLSLAVARHFISPLHPPPSTPICITVSVASYIAYVSTCCING